MRIINSFAKKHSYLFAVICVIIATALFVPGRADFAKGQWALLYLLIVGLVAGLCGVRPALLTSALAFFLWNFFFLPPYDTLTVHDPKDWLSLIVFLAVAIAMGMQTGRLRDREAQALAREREMAMLNQFSARLVSDASVSDIAELLINEVKLITGASCSALYLADQENKLYELAFISEPNCRLDPSVLSIAEWAHAQSKGVGLPQVEKRSDPVASGWPISVNYAQSGGEINRNDLFIPLQTISKQEGILYVGIKTDRQPYSISDVSPLVTVVNQTAAFLERKRLQTAAVQAESLREADKLKSTLMSSVSHELKTPISSIQATISNLASEDVEWNLENVKPELTSLQDDIDRLNGSINALLDLSRLESAAWEPKKEWFDMSDVLWTAVSKIPQKLKSRIEVLLPDSLPMVYVDIMQMSRALENLLTNALKYSPQNSPVRVGASVDEGSFRIWVEDEGTGIKPDERDKIFEKFYRGDSSSSKISGTGLGLAVTREIVRFHDGRVWVEDVVPHGARFVISLPLDGGKE
jgi:two-component system, OmpR family, sensor histidine kinase KdpD